MEYNYEKFLNGENNMLFIFGLSGSGKTTLANQLKEKLSCDLLKLEYMEYEECVQLLQNAFIEYYNTDKKIIVEGIFLLPLFLHSFLNKELFNQSFIILETNFIECIKRRYTRDWIEAPSLILFTKTDLNLYKIYKRYSYDINVIKKIKRKGMRLQNVIS